MPSAFSRRDVVELFAVALSLGTAGCLADSQNSDESKSTAQTTVSPSDVSDDKAKILALDAEEVYLSKHFANATCLEDWGTYPTTASKEASVTNRTAEGVYMDVVHPFSYRTKPKEVGEGKKVQTEADGASEASYLITDNSSIRLQGDAIAPC